MADRKPTETDSAELAMRRHEIWLALGVFSATGVVFAYVAQHDGRFEYAPEVIVVIVAVLGLGISCLTFLVWLKR